MLPLYPRSTAMLSLYLMMMIVPLAQYQCGVIEWSTVYTGLIQGLYDVADCELPVFCSRKDGSEYGKCCFDCTRCQSIHCRSHWQCCRYDITKINFRPTEMAMTTASSGNSTWNTTGNGTGNKTGTNTGNTTGNGTWNKTGNGTGNTTGNGTGNKTGNGTGNTTGNSTGNTTGNGTGNNTGNGLATNRTNYDEYIACQSVFRRENSYNNSDVKTKSVSYNMIATCPDNSTQRLKELCINNPKGPIIKGIPVLDPNYLTNGLIYRNTYCYQCHHSDSRSTTQDKHFNPTDLRLNSSNTLKKASNTRVGATSFNLALTRRSSRYFDQFTSLKIDWKSNFSNFDISNLQTKDTLVLTATLDGTEAGRVAPPSPCDLVFDLPSCNNQGQPWSLMQACSQFESPIRVINSASKQTYLAKNLACAHCVLGDTVAIPEPESPLNLPSVPKMDNDGVKKQCRLMMQTGPWLLINPLLLSDDTNDNNTEIGTRDLNTGDSICPNGFFRDKVNKQCRVILCPRHHFIYQGKCHPTFTHSVGQCYHIKVKVTFQKPISVQTSFMNRLGQTIFKVIFKKADDFLLCKLKYNVKYVLDIKHPLNIRPSKNPRFVNYFVLEIFFSPRVGMMYKDILKTVTPVLKPSYSTIGTFETYKYAIQHSDHVYLTNDQSGVLRDSIDTRSTLLSKIDGSWSFTPLAHCDIPIPITRLDICDRVHMNLSDFAYQRDKMNVNYWENVDNETVALCIEEYYNKVPYIYVKNDDKDKPDGGDETAFGTNEIIVIVLASCFVLIMITVLGTMTKTVDDEMEDVTVSDGENGEKRIEKRRKMIPLADVGL